MPTFEKLERLNALIDVWIDEEEYEKIKEAYLPNQAKTVLEDVFKYAPDDEQKDKKDWWLNLFSESTTSESITSKLPIKAIKIPPDDFIYSNEVNWDDWSECKLNDKDWAYLFCAKLIRAKIQQKGTDTYFDRLDELLVYLERNLPILSDKSDLDTTKLTVLYLLEMAATGFGPDTRSFAERARRLLKLKKFDQKKNKSIRDFYDLLARYNMGLSFFHEAEYRKAVLEFNWIIKKFDEAEKAFKSFAKDRFGRELLYLPTVMNRAQVHLKLQLAYHAYKTITDKVRIIAPLSNYKKANVEIIKAEALLQMGSTRKTLRALNNALRVLKVKLIKKNKKLEWKDVSTNFNRTSKDKKDKLGKFKGRFLGLLLWQLQDHNNKKTTKQLIKDIGPLLNFYKTYANDRKEELKGYIQLAAKYLQLLVNRAKDRKEIERYFKDIESFYDILEEYIFPNDLVFKGSFPESIPKEYLLSRLRFEHYDDFVNNMQEFYKEVTKQDAPDNKNFRKRLKDDEKKFLNLLFRIEKDYRYDLACKKRDYQLSFNKWSSDKNHLKNWCATCLTDESRKKKIAFKNLLQCERAGKEKQLRNLNYDNYEKIMNNWDNHFLDHLENPSFHAPREKTLHFLGLQRWNSASPALGRSLGGGYLIYHTDKEGRVDLGIAIDPGFDFIRNLFHSGFSLVDIDVLLLSHAHLDHIRDYESIVTLCLELDDRKKHRKKLHTIMTLGVYRRLERVIESPGLRDYIEPYILDIEKEIDEEFVRPYLKDIKVIEDEIKQHQNSKPKTIFKFLPAAYKDKFNRFEAKLPNDKENKNNITVSIIPTRAYHEDYSEYSDCFGFKIQIYDPEIQKTPYTFGYTGDTSWYNGIMEQYKKCDALLIHLGSLIDRGKRFEDYIEPEKCFELVKEKKHPYLMGMLHFLNDLSKLYKKQDKKPLILISEFGEELRGKIRLDLIERLQNTFVYDDFIFPVDVGLDVLLAEKKESSVKEQGESTNSQSSKERYKVWCVQCREFVYLDQVKFKTYGHDEALFCVCETCEKSTPLNVLQDRLRTLYEIGRELQTH